MGALLPLSPHLHTPRPSAGSQTQSYTTARLGRPCQLGPAARAPAGSDTGTLAYRLYYIQAERLVLQRSTNMSGYKHVSRDMSKPRPYQGKMWRDGKQARFVAQIASPEVCTRCGLRPTDSCTSPIPSYTRTGSGTARISCIF